MPMSFEVFWSTVTHHVNERLEGVLSAWDNEPLRDVARYALQGGKRLRPFLLAASGYALNIDIKELSELSAAVECLHAFSLVHDDLPALDNDITRRGLPSVHKAFGEDVAILLGDALLVLAFDILAHVSSPFLPMILQRFTRASLDMIRGQVLDQKRPVEKDVFITSMHLKTGAMIHFCITIPAMLAQADEKTQRALGRYGYHFGLLYQIIDDIIDEEGCLDIFGVAQSHDLAQLHAEAAQAALDELDQQRSCFLRGLIQKVMGQLTCKVGS